MVVERTDGRRQLPAHLRPRSAPRRGFEYVIRDAQTRDIPDIREIYNHYVRNSLVTFDEAPWTHRQWTTRASQLERLGLPLLVAISPNGTLLGFAMASPVAGGSSHRHIAESAIYLGQAATGKGLGRALLGALIAACEERGLRRLTAVVSDTGAEASLHLHRSLGFIEQGRIEAGHGHRTGAITLSRSIVPRRRPGVMARMTASLRTPVSPSGE